ncbi:MAG: AAA family ATPase, partial [Candidatus Omnitrophica bacterium]|nr:AAA family ATPase [Candidatus Omnitrophota bacterium]
GARYAQISDGAGEALKKIDADRAGLETLKNKLYQLQMQDKDIDYKYESIKTRLLQAYKIDLDGCQDPAAEVNLTALEQEIETLKQKLDSYGTVNLVAIDEYDELKKRYDFLIQQQNDLVTAKESLREMILKINRTTKQMFLETFEKVKLEFRNYFRLMFNGGDAQVFLIDEQDPLESGIEIICRPPGKKLQNVLLLSGGEKSMSAIALIFAIFKVKPSPFCILDEIDAALDEANVDRFSRILQEFAKESQFIVITHNKKTIVNANVMYGITMQDSGISKIVSVKFAKNLVQKDKEPDLAVPEPV